MKIRNWKYGPSQALYDKDINLSGENINKYYAEIILQADREVNLEINMDETRKLSTPRNGNLKESHNTRAVCKVRGLALLLRVETL
jgi:hypothetical protein